MKNDILKKIDQGIHTAVKNAILAHKKAGHSIVIWQDGKVVEIPPDQIPESHHKER